MKRIFCLLLIAASLVTNVHAQTKEKVISDIDKLLKNAVGSKYSDGEIKIEILSQELTANKMLVSEKLVEEGETLHEKMEYYNFSWEYFDRIEADAQEGNSSLMVIDIYFRDHNFHESTTIGKSESKVSGTNSMTVSILKKDVTTMKELLKKLKAFSKN